MMNSTKFRLLIILIVSPFCINSSIILAQMDVYLSKPEKDIFKVIGIDKTKNSSEDTSRIFEYNRDGLLIFESMPQYYMFINYRYDNEGKLIEKEALYGESFLNGTTFYYYNSDTINEVAILLASYSNSIKVLNKQKKPVSEKTWYAAGLSTESYIKQVNYEYSGAGFLQMIKYNTEYHDYNKETEDYFDMDEDDIIDELESAKIIKQENSHAIFTYKNNLIISEITYNSDSKKKIEEKLYKYGKNGKLIERKEIEFNYPETAKAKPVPRKDVTIYKYKYDNNGDLIEISQVNNGYTTTGSYNNGKLIKETETNKGSKKATSVIEYQYVYY
jgi:hypothetical protein